MERENMTTYYRLTDGSIWTTHGHGHYVPDAAEKISKAEGQRIECERAIEKLRQWIRPGSRVGTILRSASRSGMSREISIAVCIDGEPVCIDYWASRAIGWAQGKSGGIKVSGCGMDMGFHLVYALGYALWPHGTDTPHGTRNGKPDREGGYALKHSWL